MLPFFGCGDFLDEVDQDKIIPEKTDHYAALLLEEFNADYLGFSNVDHMTDNMVEDSRAKTTEKWSRKTTYTWQGDIEIDENGNTQNVNGAWEAMYEDVAIANYVIELIDEAIGEQEEIDYVKGEAYFIRALSFFNLLNLYGIPYDAATADFDLGVVLRDNIGVETTYSRNTVAEGYALIESDLMKAMELIEASALVKSKWHPNLQACYVLMSRVKLYQEKWAEAVSYANQAIDGASLPKMNASSVFVSEANSEILFSYQIQNRRHSLYDNFGGLYSAVYYASDELVGLYDDEDLRKDIFFDEFTNTDGDPVFRTVKYERYSYTDYGYMNIRLSEAFLNRAEALVQQGDVAGATSDLQAIHASRYSDASGVVYPTDAADMLTFVLGERRKELCFEDHHRWFDLRRMENRPEIVHYFTLVDDTGVKQATEKFTLFSDDLNYTLPIPLKERQNNPLIRNNERYVKIPEIEEEIIIN